VPAAADEFEFPYQDETHVETNPYLRRVWHKIGVQPTVPAAGTNRRLPCLGRVEAFGRGRVEVRCAAQDSAAFRLYLAALDGRHAATGRTIVLVLDNGPGHTSTPSRAALRERAAWRHVLWLAPDGPHRNKQEREWRTLKRDVRGHLARSLRDFAAEILAGLARLGGERCDLVDHVPRWCLDGHRRPPTGRPPGRPTRPPHPAAPPGRPTGAKDSYKRTVHRTKLAAPT
jgi:DDE superfamily endonuclease